MTNKFKPVLITLFVVVIVFWGGKYVLDSVFGDICENEIIEKVPSPNGEKVAYIFTRDCGSTTDSSSQLSILNKDHKFENKSGNTFISDKPFSISWASQNKLEVIYAKDSETFEMDKSVDGISVEYISE